MLNKLFIFCLLFTGFILVTALIRGVALNNNTFTPESTIEHN